MNKHATILLDNYSRDAATTDRLPNLDLKPVLFGLFGEVGSVMAVAKKHYREGDVFTEYRTNAEEEFGDTIWYFAALCRRLNIQFSEIMGTIARESGEALIAATDIKDAPIAQVAVMKSNPELDAIFLNLGDATSSLLSVASLDDATRQKLVTFAKLYLQALQSSNLSFSTVLQANLKKVLGRFSIINLAAMPRFDAGFPEYERIPDQFEISITQRPSGQSYLSLRGVVLGDPLTDNIGDKDGYRFHDVFHFAHAAILHWSPVFRALIKHKRKSNHETDETQDSGRAIVVEEGLSAWIFSRAKGQNFFEDQERLSFDLLKTVGQFVAGYEVAECPLALWERAILQGYAVFRKVRDNNGGIVVADRRTRMISYKPFDGA